MPPSATQVAPQRFVRSVMAWCPVPSRPATKTKRTCDDTVTLGTLRTAAAAVANHKIQPESRMTRGGATGTTRGVVAPVF